MSSTTLFTNYRPLRIGFCVRENNIDDVVLAAKLNTLLWGGVYNPIIPIDEEAKLASQLINLFKIDLLYPVSDDQNIKKFIKNHKYISWPEYHGELLYERLENAARMRVLDVSNIINFHWEKDFKHSKGSNCVLPSWSKEDPLAAVFALQYGAYPKELKLSYDHRVGFHKGLRAKTHRIVKNTNLEPDLYGRVFPINLTEDRLLLYGGGRGWDSNGVFLGYHNNVQDLIDFWNLRASGIDLIFAPIDHIARVEEIIKKHIKVVKKRDSVQRFTRGVGFWYRDDLENEVVNKIANQFLEKGDSKVFCRVGDGLWNGLNRHAPRVKFESESVLAGIDWGYNKPSLSFQMPPKPVTATSDNGRQQLVIDINPIGEFEYKGYTFNLPFFPDLNEWYARNSTIHPYGLRVSEREVGFIIDMDKSTESIHPIKVDTIIHQIFVRSGINAKFSKPGLIAQRLIERMGGDLDDCRVFKIRGVRRLISSLTPMEFVTRSSIIQTIRDVDNNGQSSFENHKSLHIKQRDAKDLSKDEVFDYLLEKNVFTAGLAPICPNCQLDFWLSLRDADEEIKCEYCGHKFQLASQLKSRGDFRFRRSGLFGRADNQEGSVPVILTLLQMLRRNGMNQLMYCTGTKLDSKEFDIDCEADFVVIDRDNWDEKVTAVIGECKTSDSITDEDVNNFLKVKNILDKNGVDAYLLFAKTSDFTEQELNRFKPLAAQNMCPILFTEKELEPYDPYDYYHDKKIDIPHPYTHSFKEMAKNSYDIYLKDKMLNALVLHGTSSNPYDNWFPWLESELQKQGYITWVPGLPNSKQPNIRRYNDYILDNKRWKINEKSTIVGHSSGAVAVLGLLQALPEATRVDTCVLVSAFKDNLGMTDLDGLFEERFDFTKIKKKAKRFILIHSDDDPYCPLKHAEYLSKKLGANLIINKGQGHFNLEKGSQYKEFPFLLDLLKKGRTDS